MSEIQTAINEKLEVAGTLPVPLASESSPLVAAATQPLSAAAAAALAPRARDFNLPGPADSSDVTDELERGGPALGSFVKSVGLAVAEAQTQLDKTLVETAKALSGQTIKVMAVFEQEIDEDGQLQTGRIQQMELPLVNYLMPTAYKWSRVFLEADMNVSEFNSKNGLNIKQNAGYVAGSTQGKYGWTGFSGSASLSAGYSSSDTAVAASASTDVAAGKLHLEATLEPRSDIELPKPFVVQKGPRLTLSATGVEDITETQPGQNGAPDTKVVVGKKAFVDCFLQKKDGSPLASKQLTVEITPGGLLFESDPGGFKTSSEGKMQLTISRKGAMFKEGTAIDVVVRVSLNYVTQTLSFKL
ncbi:MAG TPA: hypothetical protein VF516_46900 [Kofleriaceae bacterium]